MDAIRIRATRKLRGRIQVSGAKNPALPIPCTTLLSDGESLLRHVPGLRNIETIVRRVYQLGRGHRAIEKKLALVGADIARINIADED